MPLSFFKVEDAAAEALTQQAGLPPVTEEDPSQEQPEEVEVTADTSAIEGETEKKQATIEEEAEGEGEQPSGEEGEKDQTSAEEQVPSAEDNMDVDAAEPTQEPSENPEV